MLKQLPNRSQGFHKRSLALTLSWNTGIQNAKTTFSSHDAATANPTLQSSIKLRLLGQMLVGTFIKKWRLCRIDLSSLSWGGIFKSTLSLFSVRKSFMLDNSSVKDAWAVGRHETRKTRRMEQKIEVERKCEAGKIKEVGRMWEKHPRGCGAVMESIWREMIEQLEGLSALITVTHTLHCPTLTIPLLSPAAFPSSAVKIKIKTTSEMRVHRADPEPPSPTSLVLSMAFKMATFSFSRAARTLTYSPRYGPKYSGRKGEFDTNLYHTYVAGGSMIHRSRSRYTPDSLSMSRLLKDKKHPLNFIFQSEWVKINVNWGCSGNILSGTLTDLTTCSDFTGLQRTVDSIQRRLFFKMMAMMASARQQEELQMAGQVSLLGVLPVDGVIQLLHLLLCQDAIGEVRLELLQRQLPVICEEKNPWKITPDRSFESFSTRKRMHDSRTRPSRQPDFSYPSD